MITLALASASASAGAHAGSAHIVADAPHRRAPDTAMSPGALARLHAIDDLPYPDVRSIVQDDQGFIWFGVNHQSQGGLIRYDGVDTVRYANDPGDPKSLSHNQVFTTYVDDDGALWVGTIRGGLNRYHPDTDDFTRYLHDPNDETTIPSDDIKSVVQAADGTIWIGTETGLARFDSGSDTFESWFRDDSTTNSLPSSAVRVVAEDPLSHELWLGTDAGLSVFDPTTQTFNNDRVPSIEPGTPISAITYDSDGQWWIGTDDGLVFHDTDSGRSTRFANDPDDPNSLGSSDIRAILTDSRDRLWVAHGGGIDLFDSELGEAVAFADTATRAEVLGESAAHAVFEDAQGAIWVGSRFAGAARISPFGSGVEYLRHQPAEATSIGSDFVARLDATDDGLWVVTDVGVEFFDGTAFTDFSERLGIEGGWPAVAGVLAADDGTVWLGWNDGRLSNHDPSTGASEYYDVPAPADSSPVWPVAVSTEGEVWFRLPWGFGIGVLRADGAAELLIGDDVDDDGPERVYAFNTSHYFDPDEHMLWVTGLGLAGIDVTDGTVDVYSYDSTNPESVDNQLWSVDQAPDGRLWLASSQGVHEFDPVAGTFVQLHRDELPIPETTDGRFGNDGRLWLVSGSTLTGLDTNTGDVIVHNASESSITGNHLSMAPWVASKFTLGPGGRLYAPTLERGVAVFTPDNLVANPEPPPVVLTGLEVTGRAVEPGDATGAIETSINRATSIRLGHDQNNFTFQFAGLGYEHPERNQYRYRLEGFERDWHLTSADRRFATYTNVPSGDYVFRVEASNNDGVWSPVGVAVDVKIATPWYASAWARLIAIAAVAAVVTVGVRWRTRAQRARTRQLEHQLAERTRHEQERERLLDAVREQSDRLHGILAAAPVGVVLVGPDYSVLVANAVADEDLDRLTERTEDGRIERFADRSIEALTADEEAGKWFTATLDWNGSCRTISATVRPFDQHEPSGWVLLWDDVTELRDLQQQRARQERLVAVGRFAAGIAHDVNNVLTVIRGNAELLQLAATAAPDSQPRLEQIIRKTESASQIMTQVLDYSRQGVSRRELLDAASFVQVHVESFALLTDPGITIDFATEGPAPVFADPTQLERVIQNLLVNANDAIGGEGRITVVVDHTTDVVDVETIAPSEREAKRPTSACRWVRVTVSDDGCGIAADLAPSIFDPFVTSKSSGRGAGLGLAQVAGITADHGGAVTVESEPGRGATFSILLPAAEADAPTPTVARDGHPVVLGSSELILVVDDDDEVRAVVEEMLKVQGYRAISAPDGRGAVDIIDAGAPVDLIVTDLSMPGPSGAELVQMVTDRDPSMPFIVMSGVAGLGTEPIDSPAVVAVLSKPIDSVELYRGIASALANRNPSQLGVTDATARP